MVNTNLSHNIGEMPWNLHFFLLNCSNIRMREYWTPPDCLTLECFFWKERRGGGGRRGERRKTTVNRRPLKSLEMLWFGFYWNFIDIFVHFSFSQNSADVHKINMPIWSMSIWHLIQKIWLHFYPLSLDHIFIWF